MNNSTSRSMNPYFRAVSKSRRSSSAKSVTKAGVCAKIFYFFFVNFVGMGLYLADIIPAQYLMYVSIGGFALMLISSIISATSPKSTPIFGTLYSLIQGFVISWAASYYATAYDGIVFIAAIITAVVVFSMLLLYTFGVIKVGHRFRSVVSSLFLVIIFVSLITMISSFFTPTLANLFYGNGITGTIYALVCTLVFVLHLAVDFDNISNAINYRAEKMYEWSLAMGLVTTILMLFLRILELLARSRRN